MSDADPKGKGKAREERVIPIPDAPSNPYPVRITTHGKINAFVTFALQFFEKHDKIPIVFHTLPPAPSKERPVPMDPAAGPSKPKSKPKQEGGIAPSAQLAPRLLSVVEIVKREYLKAMDAGPVIVKREYLKAMDSGPVVGLFQYNEIGILEDLPEYAAPPEVPDADPEEARRKAIAEQLSGKNHVKTKQTPYMKVTLSRVELPPNAKTTAQEPLKRKLSKSAKSRAKKRVKKLAEGEAQMEVETT
uniref:DNA/RNA-binding protein Alba-like domain-containing protein n=1 Tax=Mycena chlorophos TaxID=658473 RepID=A0ABQ0LF52_MYCCL|nr:predicted protein [Mycena chlorophos]